MEDETQFKYNKYIDAGLKLSLEIHGVIFFVTVELCEKSSITGKIFLNYVFSQNNLAYSSHVQ